MLGFGKPKAPTSAATTVPDAHEEREAAVQRAIDHADAEHERRCAELTDALAQAHAEQARAVRAARANADAHRAQLDRALAQQIHARLHELADLADSDPRGAAAALLAAWQDFNARAVRELGEGVSSAHLLFACRREAGVGDLWRNAHPRGTPIDHTQQLVRAASRARRALDQGDRVLAADRLQRLRVAVRQATDLSFVDSEKTATILRHTTERDQRVALADLDERRERERQTRAAAALVPSPSTKRGRGRRAAERRPRMVSRGLKDSGPARHRRSG
jgi:hypothetical protein